MKIALILSKLTKEAKKEIDFLKRAGFEIKVFYPSAIPKKLLQLKKEIDLVYLWQDFSLGGAIAQIKYILQKPLVYRQFSHWGELGEETRQVKYLYREADKVILTDNDLEKDWTDLNLDIVGQKEVLPLTDSGIISLFQELIKANQDYDLTVCFFGSFDQFYTRNRILLKGLPQNKVKVIKVNDRSPKLKKFWKLWRMHSQIKNDYDIMFTAFQGQLITSLAWWLARLNGKKVVFDALFSLYDSAVLDRKEVPKNSFRAKFFFFLDWLACRLADIIIVHTKFHQEFFLDEFNLHHRQNRFRTLYVGVDDELLFPQPALNPKGEPFIVHFHGSYIPAQGLEHVIIGAAKILKDENIIFNLIGKGQAYPEVRRLAQEWHLTKVNFIDPVPYRVLGDYINRSDICLGSFGVSPKITRVVPLKVFESLACARALVTARTPAIEELLTDRENCLLTGLGDPQDLANKILELKNNPAFKQKIAQNGYQLYKANLTPKILGAKLKDILINL